MRIWGRRKIIPSMECRLKSAGTKNLFLQQGTDYRLFNHHRSLRGGSLAHGWWALGKIGENYSGTGAGSFDQNPGIGWKKAEKIHQSLVENLELQYVMLELLPYGVSAGNCKLTGLKL